MQKPKSMIRPPASLGTAQPPSRKSSGLPSTAALVLMSVMVMWGFSGLTMYAMHQAKVALGASDQTAKLHPVANWALYPTGAIGLIDAVNKANAERRELKAQHRLALEQVFDRSLKHGSQVFHNPRLATEALKVAESTGGLLGSPPIPQSLMKFLPQPAEVPTDASLKVLRSDIDLAATIDFQIQPNGSIQPPPITAADILLEGPRGPLHHFVLSKTSTNIGRAAIVLLFDCSSSMQGQRFTQAKAALQQSLQLAGPQTQVQLITFATSVVTTGPLSTDKNLAQQALANCKADGVTELVLGLETSLRNLEQSSAPVKAIILCTDGQDPKLPGSIDSLIQRAVQSRSKIHVLGIDDPTLDQSGLQQLAEQTGGLWTLAQQPEAISAQMDEILAQFTESSYRLTALNPGNQSPLTLTVGDLKSEITTAQTSP